MTPQATSQTAQTAQSGTNTAIDPNPDVAPNEQDSARAVPRQAVREMSPDYYLG